MTLYTIRVNWRNSRIVSPNGIYQRVLNEQPALLSPSFSESCLSGAAFIRYRRNRIDERADYSRGRSSQGQARVLGQEHAPHHFHVGFLLDRKSTRLNSSHLG